MSADDRNPRKALTAADIACTEDDLERAEDACLEALSRIRRAQSPGGDNS